MDGEISQARLYVDREMVLDFDWGHQHTNRGTKEVFRSGTIHVQVYSTNANGTLRKRSKRARYMTDAEIKKYGPIIKAFVPHVKLRPDVE